MLTIVEQKEVILNELIADFRRNMGLAKFSRDLKLYNVASKYYYKASGIKKSIHLISSIDTTNIFYLD